jgi:phosphate transport system substrate-binding protein
LNYLRTGIFAILLAAAGTSLLWSQTNTLRVVGASTIQPLAEEIARLPGRSNVLVEGGGSGVGINQVLARNADLGMVSRALSQSERQQLRYVTIGYDALVFIVNSRNPITALEKATVRRLFDGSIKQWSELEAGNGKVIPVNKEIGRSTLDLFEGYSGLLHPARGRPGEAGVIALTHQIGSNLEMATIVGGLPGAIGYLSLGTAEILMEKGMPIRILALDGVPANRRSVLDGTYGIARELNLVYREETPAIRAFIESFSSPEGIKLMESANFIPAHTGQ